MGTPRSGTTLVQRLAAELPGVRVPPETHFFPRFVPGLLRRRRFPLEGDALRAEVEAFCAHEANAGLRLDAAAVLAELPKGRAPHVVDLFGAVVRALAGPAEVYGEKTPDHLLWWGPLAVALPELRVVTVVRDPRAVVASLLRMPWTAKSHLRHAERWRFDQRLVARARTTLGPGRCVVLRYEDVVDDPDGARDVLAGLLRLGEDAASSRAAPEGRLIAEGEWWKEAALGPVTADRLESWREELTDAQAADVGAVCRREMGWFGYDGPSVTGGWSRLARMSPREHWRRLRIRRRLALRAAEVPSVLP